MRNSVRTLESDYLVSCRERGVERLSRLLEGEKLEEPFLLFGVERRLNGALVQDPRKEVIQALEDLSTYADVLKDEKVFRPLCLECDIYGVHFIDKIFEADVFDLNGSWQSRLLDQPVGVLKTPDLDNDPTWQKARDIAEAFLDSGVTVPFFGLPTIASALNVGVNLFGQDLLAALFENPDAAHHDLRVINDVLCTIHQWYIRNLPTSQLQPVIGAYRTQPPGFGQICGCTSQLISADLYRKFVAPLDAELLGVYPNGGMIHLCGAHLQHIPVWCEMKELRSIQVNDRAADDLEQYWKGLRADQVIYVNPTEFMNTGRILDLTDANRIVIVAKVTDRNASVKRSERSDR